MYYNGFIVFLSTLIGHSLAFLRLENLTVNYNERVEFRCPLPKNLSPKENIIQWKKLQSSDDGLTISINGKIPKKYDKLYRTELTNEHSLLELYHVNRQDSTAYICQTYETQTVLCQYNLNVLIAPESPQLTINDDNIREYQAVTLTCSSSNGNPPPQYTWYRNGTLLTSLNQQVSTTENSSIYTFNVTRFDNQIKYECQILNQALAVPLRLEQYLHVKYRPYVEIRTEPSLVITKEKIIGIESHEQKLTCDIDANPAATSVYWTINNTNIIRREIDVYLPRLTSEHSGVYTCVVENALGKVNQSIDLDVQYAPRVYAMESRLVVNRSNSAILRCQIHSNPLPYQVIWFKNGYEIFRQSQLSELRIDHVERNDSGVYTCTAYNRLQNNSTRNGSSTIEVIVQTRPVIETTNSKVAAEIGQTLTLVCPVSAQPKPNIYWKRNDQIVHCDEIVDEKCYLRLFQITKKDFGAYRCVAENLLGKEEWMYTIVSRGKPEAPHNIRVLDVTSHSFKVQFSPSFDGGAGLLHFVIEVLSCDKNTTSNSTILTQRIPMNAYEYTVKDLNESNSYLFRIKAGNSYGDSPWSIETSVQTAESIITPDDLPRLYDVRYDTKKSHLQLIYSPGDDRLIKLNNSPLCLNIRQSKDGNIYESNDRCLMIDNDLVKWTFKKSFPHSKLSVCSRKNRHICGEEIDMKQSSIHQSPILLLIAVVITILLALVILSLIGICVCRCTKKRLISNMNKVNKFGVNGIENGVKPTISEPRLQNPYLLYSNNSSHISPYDFASNEYQQRKLPSSFSRPYDIIDRDPLKEEISVHDANSSYGTANRTATIRASPHWLINNGGSSSRSGSNPSSELSCLTQNTNILFAANETNSNNTPPPMPHYGFPSIALTASKQHPLINGNSAIRSSSFDQQQSSSGNSTPSRMKKLFYEVVV